jgi:sugar (pentulose or hexulose) kinase
VSHEVLQAASATGAAASRVAGVGVSGQQHGLVVLDAGGAIELWQGGAWIPLPR